VRVLRKRWRDRGGVRHGDADLADYYRVVHIYAESGFTVLMMLFELVGISLDAALPAQAEGSMKQALLYRDYFATEFPEQILHIRRINFHYIL
jgi:hypothetical protein